MYSFPACAGMLVGLILYRSYTGNQNHVEFMSAAILLCPEDTVVFFLPLTFSMFLPCSSTLFPKVSGNRCDIEFILMAEYSTGTCSWWFEKLSLCIILCIKMLMKTKSFSNLCIQRNIFGRHFDNACT